KDIDGPALDWGAGGGSGGAVFRWGVHFVDTADPSVAAGVTLDVENTVAETDESNNSLTVSIPTMAFSPRFGVPLAGTQGVDWSIVNFSDADRNSPAAIDYLGGPWTYDGHDALDITLPHFRRADQGVAIYAVAAGTVVDAHDGEFDRVP